MVQVLERAAPVQAPGGVAVDVLVLTGTKDGVHLLRSGAERGEWQLAEPSLVGHDVCHVVRDDRDGSLWAAANPKDGAPVIFRSHDDGQTWAKRGDLPECERVWQVRPGRADQPGRVWAGIMPANLLRSDDGGETWQDVPGLNAHPSRAEWFPGGGGLCLHTIVVPENQPGRMYVAISAAGVFRSDDDGLTWAPANEGTTSFACFMQTEMPEVTIEHPEVYRCVHKITLDPRNPETLYTQSHDGIYRSDDGSRTWRDIGAALPSRFGFPIAAAPGPGPAGCTVFLVPQDGETLRTAERLRVWCTEDGGETWTPSEEGLPEGEHNVLREAMAADLLDPAGIYVGTTGGLLFASLDGGMSWSRISEDLPPIRSIEVSSIA